MSDVEAWSTGDALDMANERAERWKTRYLDKCATLERVREFVDYPGNWSTLDGRRRVLLDLLDGKEVEWER